jgi:hypothetical protein
MFFCDCVAHATLRKPLCTTCFQKKEAVRGCAKRCHYTPDCREASHTTNLDGIDICRKHHDLLELTKEEKIVQEFLTDREKSLFRGLDQNTFVWTTKRLSHVFRHKIPFGKRVPGKDNRPRTQITRRDLLGCMKNWGHDFTDWDMETVRIVVEMMSITKDPGSETYDIVNNGLLAVQTSGTTCTDLECLKTRFLCLYADLMTDLNPIAMLIGGSEEANAIRDMPTSVSTTTCTCGYWDESFDDMFTECTCGIEEATEVLYTQRSMALRTYIRTHELCRENL